MDENAKKKKPGRPRKKIVRKVRKRLGVVDRPINFNSKDQGEIHTMELVYDNPSMFKRIFMLFRSMQVKKIQMLFKRDSVVIVTNDHGQKNTMYVKIHGSKQIRYYCSHTIQIGLNPKNINRILQTLNKDYTVINMVAKRSTERSKIRLILQNEEMEVDKIYDIEVDYSDINISNIDNLLKDEEAYPIKFELPAKFFKKDINDYSGLARQLSIEKHGTSPICFKYQSKDSKVKHISPFKNPGKINLQSTVEEGDIFATSFYLADVKPLSSSLVSDIIHISADKYKPLIFTAYLDEDLNTNKKKVMGTETCFIKIITKIIDLKTPAK